MNKDVALKMLIDVRSAFRGVPWWLDFGTMLGAYRDQDFIPWDHDIDIGIWAQDSDKVKALCKYGFSLKWGGGKRAEYCWARRGGECVDIFLYYPNGEFAGRAWNHPSLQLRGFFHARHFRILATAQIRGETFLIPGDTECYMRTLWGDWKTPRKKGFDYWGGCLFCWDFSRDPVPPRKIVPRGMTHA